jgi:hypothetical protein
LQLEQSTSVTLDSFLGFANAMLLDIAWGVATRWSGPESTTSKPSVSEWHTLTKTAKMALLRAFQP